MNPTALRSPATVVLSSFLLLGLVACQKSETSTETKPAMPEAKTTAAASPEDALALESTDQKVSYFVGLQMGGQLAQDKSLAVDLDALSAGISDALAGKEPRIPQAELMAAIQAKRSEAQAASQAKAQANLEAGKAFLAKNAQRPEVTTTASGLQYEVLQPGAGPKPTQDQTVKVHYHGTLLDGTVFDSSVQRGQPIEFPVTGVIKGWIEALQLMPVGSKWKLYIPADLAYGNQDRGTIPPGSTLIFEVELLDVK